MNCAERIEKLLEQYERPLVAYAYSLAGELETARDAVQNAFIKYVEKTADDPGAVTNPKAWLYRVSHNQVMDVLRKSQRQQKMEAELRQTQTVHDRLSPSRELEMKTMRENLREEVKKLNELEQRVFQLRVYRELSYKEISAELEIETSHVGVILHRALRKLSGQVKNEIMEVL